MDKVLLVVNSRAGSVSVRTKEVIAKALSADFKLEVSETERREHAGELARDAAGRGFAAVICFGGDGTINETAQGVIETDTALGILPGGSTNVMARTFGIPPDPVEATAFVANRLRSRTIRRVNVGKLDGRYFIASCGMGLDAEVVRRLEADPESKRRWGEWAFVKNALAAAFTEYRGAEPAIRLSVDGSEPVPATLAVCSNLRPFTYFKRWPVDACPRASLDEGLDVLSFRKIHLTTIPRMVYALFVSRSHIRWRITDYTHDAASASLTSSRPLPLQVDGDYIGERDRAEIHLVPEALALLV